MKTAEIKKGMRMQLKNGWFATMMDNGRGTTRMAEVEGFYTETGSIYSFDIARVLVGDQYVPVEYTEKELKVQEMNKAIFG